MADYKIITIFVCQMWPEGLVYPAYATPEAIQLKMRCQFEEMIISRNGFIFSEWQLPWATQTIKLCYFWWSN